MKNKIKVIIPQRGIGFCGLLFIILLLLKVGVVKTTVVGWSWIWIFSPLWGPLALVMSIPLLIIACMMCAGLIYLGFLLIVFIVIKIKRMVRHITKR